MDAGFDGTMVDFGEIIPDEAVFYDGRTGDEMHNAYALDYTKAYRKLFEKYKGEDHVLFQDLRQRVFKSIPASLVETSFQVLEA